MKAETETLLNSMLQTEGDHSQHISDISELGEEAKRLQDELDCLSNESSRKAVSKARVIFCTTAELATHRDIVNATAPEVVLVMEAEEVLEAYVVASLNPSVEQLILIGVQERLQTSVSDVLTIEKGAKDPNLSMFERLIHSGYQYTVLQEPRHGSQVDAQSDVSSSYLTEDEVAAQPPPAKRQMLRLPVRQATHASSAQMEWEDWKRKTGHGDAVLDELMGMIGLETIKQEFLSLSHSLELKVSQRGVTFSGETQLPITGKPWHW